MNGTAAQVDGYLDRVRAALGDLPAQLRDELLEDQPGHLAEVLAEGVPSLEDRLGTPEAYAAELRAAAGIAPVGTSERLESVLARVRPAVQRFDVAAGPLFGYSTVGELLRLLRPGWWVLRGYFAGLLLLFAVAGRHLASWVPPIDDGLPVWLLVVGAMVVGSVRLGRLAPRLRPRWRGLIGVGTGVLLLLMLANFTTQPYSGYVPVYSDPYSNVTDVYPYGPDGRPLSGVRLYDQSGNPLFIGTIGRCDATLPAEAVSYPLCPPEGWQPRPTGTIEPTTSPSASAVPTGTR